MADAQDFDFTEAEMFAALSLVTSEKEAREAARAVVHQHQPGMSWGVSERTLLLLSLASESGRARVERIRRGAQEDRRSAWLVEVRAKGGKSEDELARRWAELLAAEDLEWEGKRTVLRRTLRELGKLPPEKPG